LMLLILVSAALSQGSSISGPVDKNALIFDENNVIKVAQANLTVAGLNRSYPFGAIAIYNDNQTISGTFQGPSWMAGAMIRVSLARLRASEFLKMPKNNSKNGGNGSQIRLNSTGGAHFSLPGAASGAYLISIVDVLNLTTLYLSPVLVTKGDLSISSPSDLNAEGMTRIRVKASEGNETKIFGGIMMPKKEYDTACLSIGANGTTKDLLATVTLGNRSLQIKNISINSSQLMMSALAILPADSALAYQESKEPEAELVFLTDEPLEKGEYMLTCAIYSSRRGLLGLEQREMEVV